MKNILLLICLLTSVSVFAETKKSEPSLEIKTHIVKIMLTEKKNYSVELDGFAAVYHADEKFVPCLQKAMADNKQATLKFLARSLIIQECNVK